jgi:hypothetical protein
MRTKMNFVHAIERGLFLGLHSGVVKILPCGACAFDNLGHEWAKDSDDGNRRRKLA